MSAVKEARKSAQRLERRRRSVAMTKCPCGNVAGLNQLRCGRCRDIQAGEDARELMGKQMHYKLTREQWAAAGNEIVRLGPVHHDNIVAAVWDAIWRTAP